MSGVGETETKRVATRAVLREETKARSVTKGSKGYKAFVRRCTPHTVLAITPAGAKRYRQRLLWDHHNNLFDAACNLIVLECDSGISCRELASAVAFTAKAALQARENPVWVESGISSSAWRYAAEAASNTVLYAAKCVAAGWLEAHDGDGDDDDDGDA